ncbi:alpha/beta hydrolase [Phenylobacterium sp. LjRoot219]|uniref:alpha/beta hydrolase n=1 Tax=Phenylobacterium sp. LjRoot219 TaxID=3342283 RepID=UPI003ECDC115
MPVLPPIKPIFDAMNAPAPRSDVPPAEARAAMHAMIEQNFSALSRQPPPLPSERDHQVPAAGGEITVRVYSQGAGGRARPCYLYLHGGGFWLGTLDQSNALCRTIAVDADCVVASVDYRLAPEHKFPTAAEDGYAALLWVAAHAAELGVDAARIAVGGGSAGGNLAAVVSLIARDRGGPRPVLQLLEIPVTDMTRLEPLRIPEEDLVVEMGKDVYGGYYLADPADATNPYASPLLAPSLSDLPPALVMCAEYDPLRPEGEAYADRLRAAGVPVEYRCWEGQFHGSQNMAALIPEAAAAYRAQVTAALQRAFGEA